MTSSPATDLRRPVVIALTTSYAYGALVASVELRRDTMAEEIAAPRFLALPNWIKDHLRAALAEQEVLLAQVRDEGAKYAAEGYWPDAK